MTDQHREMLALRDDLLRVLAEAMKDRSRYTYMESGAFGSEPMRAIHERQAVARELERRQCPVTVSYEQQYEIEQSAAGHSDYAAKYTLRLAMAAYGQDWKP